jgi:hypothetical protein
MAGPQFSRYPSSSTPRGPRGVGGGVGTGAGGVGGGVGGAGGVGAGGGVGVGLGVGAGGAGLSQSALFWQTVTPSLPQIGPDPPAG